MLITSCFLAKQATFVFYLFSPFILYYRPLILYYGFEDIFLQILKNTRLQEVERKVSIYVRLPSMTSPNFSCINAPFLMFVTTNYFMFGKKVTLKKAPLGALIFTIFFFFMDMRRSQGEVINSVKGYH